MAEELAVRPPMPVERGQHAPPAVMSDDEIRRLYRVAEGLAASGMFKDATQAKQAFAKLVIGHDLGLSVAQSMQGLYFVKGAVQIAYPMLGNFVRRHKDYDYKVVEHTAETCTIVFYRFGEEEGVSTFTFAEAEAAGLVKDDSAWKKSPRNMVFARAMSNGCKWYCPDVLGGVPVYVEGEIVDRPQLTAGEDAEPAGIELGPKVEQVIARATELGHAGLGEDARAAIEMTLGSRSPEAVNAWVRQAMAELDAFEPQAGETEGVASEGEPVDAEVAPSDPVAKPEPDPDGEVDDTPSAGHDDETTQARYDRDPDWRGKVDRLLHRQADLEGLVDDVPADRAGEINAELDAVDEQLKREGVPAGWRPVTAGQAGLGI